MENVLIDPLSEQSRMWISSTPKGEFLEFGKDRADTENNSILNYLIFNALGKVELQGTLLKKRRIDIHSLGRGIYFIQFLLPDETQVTRQFMKV